MSKIEQYAIYQPGEKVLVEAKIKKVSIYEPGKVSYAIEVKDEEIYGMTSDKFININLSQVSTQDLIDELNRRDILKHTNNPFGG